MPFFENQSRDQLRQMYFDAWQRRRGGLPLEALQAQIADVIELHPEYHPAVLHPDALQHDYTPEQGQSNPFLHMGLHLAVRDQVVTDRPGGLRRAFEELAARVGSIHDAEHRLMECLAETLWEAQRAGTPPDEQKYLERVRGLR
jgi:hypothetical protein